VAALDHSLDKKSSCYELSTKVYLESAIDLVNVVLEQRPRSWQGRIKHCQVDFAGLLDHVEQGSSVFEVTFDYLGREIIGQGPQLVGAPS
jgi:hypothetical protein